MSLPLTPNAYRDLIQDDIEWLKTVPRTLEREHILQVLEREFRDAERICRYYSTVEDKDQP